MLRSQGWVCKVEVVGHFNKSDLVGVVRNGAQLEEVEELTRVKGVEKAGTKGSQEIMLSRKWKNTTVDEGRDHESIYFTLKADENKPGERTRENKDN